METKNRNLRNRKDKSVPGKKTYAQVQDYVSEMSITLEDKEGNQTVHGIVFDKEPLTLKEMYSVGFLGDVEYRLPDGKLITEELEAGPVGQFEGEKVGRFVFRFNNAPYSKKMGIRIKKLKFSKKTY